MSFPPRVSDQLLQGDESGRISYVSSHLKMKKNYFPRGYNLKM
jgi:hypothetical protein